MSSNTITLIPYYYLFIDGTYHKLGYYDYNSDNFTWFDKQKWKGMYLLHCDGKLSCSLIRWLADDIKCKILNSQCNVLLYVLS